VVDACVGAVAGGRAEGVPEVSQIRVVDRLLTDLGSERGGV
jgi:hypothetical protein